MDSCLDKFLLKVTIKINGAFIRKVSRYLLLLYVARLDYIVIARYCKFSQ